MENASKALLMAGGVLIGIIILSVLVYAFRTGGNFATTTDDVMNEASLAKFNSQFTMYEGKSNLTVHDVLSIMNLAENCGVEVSFSNGERMTNDLNQLKKELEAEAEDKIATYTLEYVEYDNLQKVNKITFIKNR